MTPVDEAAAWLRQLLAAGPVAANDVRRLAAERRHSWRTMQRAKRTVGADAQRVTRRGRSRWQCLLSHPVAIRCWRHAGDVDATGSQVNEEQHVKRDDAAFGDHVLGEEVGGPQRVPVPLEKLLPGRVGALRSRVDPILLQDAAHGGVRNPHAEIRQDAVNPRRARASAFAGQFENQRPDFIRLSRPTAFAGGRHRLARIFLLLTDPAGERARRDDRDQILDRSTERPTDLQQSRALGRRYCDPLGQPASQDAVLGLQVLEVAGQLFVGGLGQQQQQGLKESLRDSRIHNSLRKIEMT